MLGDLAKSNLHPKDIQARTIDTPERAMTLTAHSTQGYVIPYFNLHGKPLPFYRVRLFDHDPKYRQPKDTPSTVYFPPSFLQCLEEANTDPTNPKYIIITEGEKKAACATKFGFPACALGGVDAWRNRTIILPGDVTLSQSETKITAKVPSGKQLDEDQETHLAMGMQELLDYAVKTKATIIIVYDSDTTTDGTAAVKPSVQRAAATLAFELRFRGIPFSRIRQIALPSPSTSTSTSTPTRTPPPLTTEAPPLALIQPTAMGASGRGQDQNVTDKIGLDDFLVQGGDLQSLIDECLQKKSAFPLHPSIRDFVNRRLQHARLSRKETQAVSMAILSELDSSGLRLRSRMEAQTYYFDTTTRRLLKAEFDVRGDIYDSAFGQFLYRRFGLSAADHRLITWLAAQFTGEDPIEDVSPYRVFARKSIDDDCVYYQLSDSHYVSVDAAGIKVHDNGDNGILFESEQVKPVDVGLMLKKFEMLDKEAPPNTPVSFLWRDVLSSVRLRDQTKQKILTGLLYYISPWLYRWRGMQLPVEMIVGESGSGKSTLCELRLSIISGTPKLRNAPQDLRDWHASVANTGGLHVTDNVQLVDKNLRQRLSDEICRIITEPAPSVEMRRLYSNAELMQIPVNVVFALTSIQQPFMNADLVQRSIILDLDKLSNQPLGERPDITYDSEWRSNQLERFGGREGWIAHHLLVLHRFFQLVKRKWQNDYKAKHRLVNFEQAIMLMAETLGVDPSWLPDYLVGTVEKGLTESDWTFQGIKTFVDTDSRYHSEITALTIADWAAGNEDFLKCENLTNPRRLAHYIKNHRTMVASIIGLVEHGMVGSRQAYRIIRKEAQ